MYPKVTTDVMRRPRSSLDAHVLKPLLRAYIVGYLSSTSPRILATLLSLLRKGHGKDDALAKLLRSLRGALAINRFPTFCGVLVGGSSLLEAPIQHLLTKTLETLQFGDWKRTVRTQRRSARFLSTLLAAWLGFALLNYRPKEHDRETKGQVNGDGPNAVLAASVPVDDVDPAQSSAYGRPQDLATTRSPESPGVKDEPAGRTIDLTLFAATRAADVLIGELWSRRKSDRIVGGQWTRLEEAVGRLTDAGVFAVSASLVMWAWFYIPDRLPRAYNNWIRDAAEVDGRLVTALRRARRGEFVYGEDTGQAPMLQGMCRDYDLPLEWGDPARCIPLPCEVVHMGAGPSCERHAASRFLRAFKFSLTMYLPLNLLLRARSPSARALQQALKDAIRSSTFLAAFISLFYYGICLGRTRAGPRLFGPLGVTAQDWDSGLDVGTGCVMCGWSILIEAERRRQEIAFFVAPRAAATFFPRQYDPKYRWRETLAFTVSAAIVFTCVREKPERVRGVLGRVLKQVLNEG